MNKCFLEGEFIIEIRNPHRVGLPCIRGEQIVTPTLRQFNHHRSSMSVDVTVIFTGLISII